MTNKEALTILKSNSAIITAVVSYHDRVKFIIKNDTMLLFFQLKTISNSEKLQKEKLRIKLNNFCTTS